jgi:hypothetical protein
MKTITEPTKETKVEEKQAVTDTKTAEEQKEESKPVADGAATDKPEEEKKEKIKPLTPWSSPSPCASHDESSY